MGVADTEVSVLLDAGLWAGIEGEAPMAGPCVWGVDLGTSAAHSEVGAFWPETGALACLAAFPEQPSLDEWGRRDGVAGLCRECHRRGELLTVGRRSVDVDTLLQAALPGSVGPSRLWPPDGGSLSCGARWRGRGSRSQRSRLVAWASGTAAKMCERSGGPAPTGGAGAVAAAALRDGRGRHRLRSGGQRLALEGLAGWAPPAGSRRRRGRGDLGGR